MVIADKGVTPDSPTEGDISNAKIAGEKTEVSSVYNVDGTNSDNVKCGQGESTENCMAAPIIEVLEDSVILIHENMPSDFFKFGAVREESSNNESFAVNNSENMILSHDIQEKDQICDLNFPLVSPFSYSPSKEESNKLPVNVVGENIVESPFSEQICVELLEEEVCGGGKKLEWLDPLNKTFQEAKKDSGRFTCREKGHINFEHSPNGVVTVSTPGNSHVQIGSNQGDSCAHINQSITIQKRTSISGLNLSDNKMQPHEGTSNQSTVRSNYVGLYLPLNSEVPLDYIDVIARTKMLKERKCCLNYESISTEWSEEELDSLWIGVRKHGIHNWSSMLKDQNLHFSESRIDMDLARQWNLEQSRFLSRTQIQNVILSGPVISSSSENTHVIPVSATQYGNGVNFSQTYSELPTMQVETNLNIKDTRLRKVDKLKKNMFGSSPAPLFSSFMVGSPSMAQTKYKKRCMPPIQRQFPISSNFAQSANRNIHALREDIHFSNKDEMLAQYNGDQSKGKLKRKSPASCNYPAALRASDIITWTSEPLNVTPLRSIPPPSLDSQKTAPCDTGPDQHNSFDLNKKVSVGGDKGDYVFTDTSSKDNISDDNQRQRHHLHT